MTKYAGRDLTLRSGTRQSATGVASTDVLTAGATHGLVANDLVVFTSITGGAGLAVNTVYHVIATGLTSTAFEVSATQGGSAVNFTTDISAATFYKSVLIGQLTSTGPSGSSRDLIDASAYGDAFKDYVVGQQDGAEIELSVAYDPADASHVALKAQYDAGVTMQMEMAHATATTFHIGWPAILTKLERGGDRDGLLVMNITAKVLTPGPADISGS